MSLADFPDALPVDRYIARTQDALARLDFGPDNTLVLLDVCREPASACLAESVHRIWSRTPFSLLAMGAVLVTGRTRLAEARSHAPVRGGRQRFVVYAMPHLGLGTETGCHALAGILSDLTAGREAGDLDPDDLEQSVLRRRLLPRLRRSASRGIRELTEAARRILDDDLLDFATRMRLEPATDVAAFSGIHLRTPHGDFIAPGPAFAHVDDSERRVALSL